MAQEVQPISAILNYVLFIVAIAIALGVLRLIIKRVLDNLVTSGRISPSLRSTVLTIVNLFIATVVIISIAYVVIKEYSHIVVIAIGCLILVGLMIFHSTVRSYLAGIALRTSLKPAPYTIYLPQHKLKIDAVNVKITPQYVEIHDVYGNTYMLRNEQVENAILAQSFVNIPIEILVEYECIEMSDCSLFVEKVVTTIENEVFTGTKKDKRIFINEVSKTHFKILVKLNPINYPIRALDLARVFKEIADSVYKAFREAGSPQGLNIKNVLVRVPMSGIEIIE